MSHKGCKRGKHGLPGKYRCLWPAGLRRGQVGWRLGVFLRTSGNQVKSREEKRQAERLLCKKVHLNIFEIRAKKWGEMTLQVCITFSSLDPWQ